MQIISFALFILHTIPIFAVLKVNKFPNLISYCNCLSINIFGAFFHCCFHVFKFLHLILIKKTLGQHHVLLTKPSCNTSKYGTNPFVASAMIPE